MCAAAVEKQVHVLMLLCLCGFSPCATSHVPEIWKLLIIHICIYIKLSVDLWALISVFGGFFRCCCLFLFFLKYMGNKLSNCKFKMVIFPTLLFFQSYSNQGRGSSGGGGGAGDEDYEIPPITPPNHADPSLLHLMEHETGYPFHSLPHNGLLNTYAYPELPALMMSNMLGQDTHLLSGPVHSVSSFPPFFLLFFFFSCDFFWMCKSSPGMGY